MFICCVPHCDGKSKMHRFPKRLDIYKVWIEQIRRLDLNAMEPSKVQISYRVCDRHFCEEYRIPGRHGADIILNAIPTLYLPDRAYLNKNTPSLCNLEVLSGPSMVSEELLCLPQSTSAMSQCMESQQLSSAPEVSEKLTEASDSKITTPGPSLSFQVFSTESQKDIGQPRCVSPVSHRRFHDQLSTPKTRKDLRRPFSILRSMGVNNTRNLSPKALKVYRIARNFRRLAQSLRTENVNIKERLRQAREFSTSPEFLRTKLNAVTYKFVLSQIQNQRKSQKGRRFDLEDKVFALSLLKQSPRGYRLLQKIFALPSRKTLTNLLKNVPFNTGVNKSIMVFLKNFVEKMHPLDKYCIIMFDEIALEPSLQFSKTSDKIIGFQDNGQGDRQQYLADKAMVFMAKGIHAKWKQPLAYFFNDGGMKKSTLASALRDIIRAVRNVGLKVVATVCDQGTANVAAIQILYRDTNMQYTANGQENRNFGFEIDGEEVVPLYDPPHLLKGIRNGFFNYDVEFTWRMGHKQVAKWAHIRRLADLEDEDFDYKLCSKLTSDHYNNSKKMKVSVAAQTLSARVAASIKSLARHGPEVMPPDAIDTAEFIMFMDKLFDSVNGISATPAAGKSLRCAVSTTSPHEDFWNQALEVLNTVSFVTQQKKPPSLRNWIHTIKAFKYLWHKLRDIGFNFLCTRHLNQDSVENFFGAIRSHGARNVYPNCMSFVASFKTLLINNCMSVHSPHANCENDDFVGLDCIRQFVSAQVPREDELIPLEDVSIFSIPDSFKIESVISQSLIAYLAGYTAKHLLKVINNCIICKTNLIGDAVELDNLIRSFIDNRCYRPNALLYPNCNFYKLFREILRIIIFITPTISEKSYLTTLLHQNVMNIIDHKNVFNCKTHKLLCLIIEFMIRFHIHTWCKNINRILKGKIKIKSTTDIIKSKAQAKYQSHCRAQAKIKAVKATK